MFTIGADEALRTHPQTQNATIYIDIACIQETHKDRTDTQANGERERKICLATVTRKHTQIQMINIVQAIKRKPPYIWRRNRHKNKSDILRIDHISN